MEESLSDLPSLKVKKWEWYWDQNSVHKRAERTFVALPIHNIGVDNITKMILGALTNEGGLTPHQIRDRFMAFGADGVSVL